MYQIGISKKVLLWSGLVIGQLINHPTRATVNLIIVEFIVYVISCILGVGFKLAFRKLNRVKTTRLDSILITFVGFGLGLIADFVLYNLGNQWYRPVGIALAAFLGELILIQINIKFPSVFSSVVDSTVKRTLGIDCSEENETDKIEEKDDTTTV